MECGGIVGGRVRQGDETVSAEQRKGEERERERELRKTYNLE